MNHAESNRSIVDQLLEIFPDFRVEWERYRQSDQYVPGTPYLHVAVLARYLVDSLKNSNTGNFGRLFDRLEILIANETDRARNLIASGLLEGVQDLSLAEGIPLEEWERWLGPRALLAWHAIKEFWSGAIEGAEFNERITDSRSSTRRPQGE